MAQDSRTYLLLLVGRLTRCKDDIAFVIREHRTYEMSLTGIVTAPFRFTLALPKIGTVARRAIAEIPGGYSIIARDNVLVIGSGNVQAIGDQVRESLLPLM